MDAIFTAQSIQSINAVLQMTTVKSMESAEKIMKVAVAESVGSVVEAGKGQAIDIVA